MTYRKSTLIDNLVEPALKATARRDAYFTKREVVHEVLKRHNLVAALKDIRRTYGGYGLDEAILRYIDGEVGRALQQRDARGFRVYECFSDGSAERRWRRFRQMNASDLAAVIKNQKVLRNQLTNKIGVYEAFLAELQRLGKEVKVGQVYDKVCRRLLHSGITIEREVA